MSIKWIHEFHEVRLGMQIYAASSEAFVSDSLDPLESFKSQPRVTIPGPSPVRVQSEFVSALENACESHWIAEWHIGKSVPQSWGARRGCLPHSVAHKAKVRPGQGPGYPLLTDGHWTRGKTKQKHKNIAMIINIIPFWCSLGSPQNPGLCKW